MGRFENVSVEVSGVLHAQIARAWEAASCFEDTNSYIPESFLKDNNRPLARRRVVTLGAGRLHEELTFLDNDRFSLLYQVSISDDTYIRIHGSFTTEPEMAETMLATWKAIYRNLIEGLGLLLKVGQQPQDVLPVKAVSAGAAQQAGTLIMDTRQLFEHNPSGTRGSVPLPLQQAGPSSSSGSSSQRPGLHIGQRSVHWPPMDSHVSQMGHNPNSPPTFPSQEQPGRIEASPTPLQRINHTRLGPEHPVHPQPVFQEGMGNGFPTDGSLRSPVPLHLLSLPFFAS